MIHPVSRSVVRRVLSVATVLTLVAFVASVDLQPNSALAAPGMSADPSAGVVYLAVEENPNNDENRNNNDENRNHDDTGNRENGNGEDRAADTGPQIAFAGNGGVATASADGGVVFIGDINSGGNAGNAIAAGDTTWGSVRVDGGNVVNSTEIAVTADGGMGIADTSGGNGNLAGVQE